MKMKREPTVADIIMLLALIGYTALIVSCSGTAVKDQSNQGMSVVVEHTPQQATQEDSPCK